MAQAFNLTAQINLRGPTNTRAIASQIRRQLSDINVRVNLDLNGAQARNIAAINTQLQQLVGNARAASQQLQALNNQAANLGTGMGQTNNQANQTSNALGRVTQQATTTGRACSVAASQIQEFGRQSGLAIRRFAAFSAVTGVVYGLTSAVNSAFKEFVQFDKQLVRLSQVTGSSTSALSDITKEITRLSTGLGVASSDLIGVSVTLAQAGLSAEETKSALEALAKSALAPSFDSLNDTVEGSIALMRQFDISTEELEASLGSINAVAASFAVEAGDIIKAIQRTGGVFAAASNGVSQGTDALNEFIALFTSVRATTREGSETIATGLRTIFTRIQRGSTIDALKEFGVTLTDIEGKFVGPYEAVRRLSEGLAGLDPRDLRFSQIVEELGGFRQIGKVIPLLQQFSTAQEALKVAQSGQDSLAKNAITAQLSLANQFQKTRESFVALIRDLGNSGTFKTIATITLTTANAFITLAGALKPLLPLLTALTAIKGASILGEFGSGFLGGLGRSGGGGGGRGRGGRGFATGGLVPGSGNRDTVSAMLTPGEYVIRKKAVEKIGVENLEKLNSGGRVKGYAGGGGIEQGKQFGGVGIFDSDMIGGGAKNVLDAIMASGKPYDVLSGPAGSGKTTFATQRFGKNFVLSAEDIANYAEFMVLSGAGPTKSGDFSDAAKGIMSGARKVMALRASEERVMQQRQARLNEAIKSGSPDKRSVKQLEGTFKAPASIDSDLYSQFGNVEFIQKFGEGRGVEPINTEDIKITDSGRINKGVYGRLTQAQAQQLLTHPAASKNETTVKQLNNRIKQLRALDNVSQYGLAGLYGKPREVTTKAADGTTVKLIGKTLDKTISDSYESQMILGFKRVISVIGSDMASRVNAQTTELTSQQLERAGLYNYVGAALEASIATLGTPYDKDETRDPIDFAGGLGPAASLFGLPPDMPTDTTRTVFGKGKSPKKFLGQVNNFRAAQAKKLATGGSIEDTVPALLTPGEYVINKQAAKKLGSQKLDQLNRADRIQGFNSGGSVGFVQRFAAGGGAQSRRADKMAYLERIAAKLGITVQKYEQNIRSQIIRKTERRTEGKRNAQTSLENLLVKNLDGISNVDVENMVRQRSEELITKLYAGYGNIDPDILNDTITEIVDGMKQGMSVDELKNHSQALKDLLDTEINARDELVGVQEEMANKLGFLTAKMKVSDLDIRAQRSIEAGKFGITEKLDPRRAQLALETPLGQVLDKFGEALTTKNIPGMKKLGQSFPAVANRLTMLGDKVGGITGIVGSGAALLGSKMTDIASVFDYFAGTVSETSETLAGVTGALQKGGSLGVSGAILGQQYGNKGAAIGGAAGLVLGGAAGFIESSVAKETENAFKAITESASELDKTFSRMSAARTPEERKMQEEKLMSDYIAYSRAIEQSAKTIEDNRIWKAVAGGLNGFTSALTTASGLIMAAALSAQAGSVLPIPGAKGKVPRRGKARGGRIGYAFGGAMTSMVPVHLASGEGVIPPEMAARMSDVQLRKLNNADRNGFGASSDMLPGGIGVVPGKGTGKVDNFKTNLPEGSYVIRSQAMNALFAANGGKIGRNSVSTRGFASGGTIPRQGHFAGALVRLLPTLLKVGGALKNFGTTLKKLAPTLGTLTNLTLLLSAGSSIMGAISGYGSQSDISQQLQNEIAMLSRLKELVDITRAQSTSNRRYSERIIKASDDVERKDAAGQFVLTEEQRKQAYSRFRNDDGTLNTLNRLGEGQARIALAKEGVVVPDDSSVQEFLDALKVEDINAYNRAQELITKGHQDLTRILYIEARVRNGVSEQVAAKEFDQGGERVQQVVNDELMRENRADVLAQRMEIIGRSISKFTLNLKDVMDRLSASLNRTSVEAGELFNRLDSFTSGLTGANAGASQARTRDADVLKNVTAYSTEELDRVVSSINDTLGNTEETRQMGDFIRGFQIMQNELPMILRQAGGLDLEENQTEEINKSLGRMFDGIQIGGDIKRKLTQQILDVVGDKTGGSKQPLTFEELADQVTGLKELSGAADQARQVFLQVAEQQIEMNNRLAQATDRLSSMIIESSQLGIRANTIQLDAAMQLKKTFGQTVSLQELVAPFEAEINGLLAVAGGRGNMTIKDMADKIIELNTRKAVLESNPDDQTRALASGEIETLTTQINAYQKAIDKLANSTDRADAAMQKIAEQERISEARRQGTLGFLGMVNDPQAMMKFVQEQQSMEAVMGANQPGARGANLNDVVSGLQALQQMEGLMNPQEFAEKQQQYVENALKIVAQAAGPGARFVEDLLKAIQKDFERDPDEKAKLDPEFAALLTAYRTAISEQTIAVQQQKRLMDEAINAQRTGIIEAADDFAEKVKSAAATAAAALEAAAARIGLQDVQGIEAGPVADAAAAAAAQAAAGQAAGALNPPNSPDAPSGDRTWAEFLNGWTGFLDLMELTLFKPGEAMGIDFENERRWMRGEPPREPVPGGGWSRGGLIYASKGRLINFTPKGTDTVPAMLTPGEFVINRSATRKNLPLLKAINGGANVNNVGGSSYASTGGIMKARGYFDGGSVASSLMKSFMGGGSIENLFNTFISDFNRETKNFGDLINNFARIFPALNGPINIFGNHIEEFRRSINSLKNIEIKGPNIPETVKFQGGTIRVELIAPTDNNYKLSDEDKTKITSELEQRLKSLITLGR